MTRRRAWFSTLALLVLPATAAAQVPRLSPVGLFGCDDCTGPAQFATVHALGVTADTLIVIADADRPLIRIFDAHGRFRQGFSRTGDGPGELRLPIGIGMVDGSLVAVDMRGQRVTRFASDGRTLGTSRINGFPSAAAFPPHGGTPVIVLATFTEAQTTIARLHGDSVVALRTVGAAEFPERAPDSFDLLPVAAAPDGSFAIGDGIGAYRIQVFRPDGVPLRTITRDVQRARLTAGQMQELREQRDRSLSHARARAAAESRSPAASFTPPPVHNERNFFHLGALAFDELGRLWVRVERGPLTQSTFDVFDAAGRYLGEVRLAARVRATAFGAGLLAAVVLDELDIPRIGVWHVQ